MTDEIVFSAANCIKNWLREEEEIVDKSHESSFQMTSIFGGLFSRRPNARPLLARWEHGKIDSTGHRVNNLEKKFLVWTGKYKSVDEVPNYVSQAVVERARNRMRIRIANYMMLATAIGCIAMVYSGKQAAKRGESVQQQNLQWHKETQQQEK
ncbi:hypothetical protein NQ318_019812 [Aromia moschata]|uniref:Uncharacterized protein n=1 Tax=Aromia moschata TaxID=1265417 RepID=A0AAV8YK09_9CUCU|nr:hypothetical protein NQ318_019812 [Aromia moschata]